GYTGTGAPVETGVFEIIQSARGFRQWVTFGEVVDQLSEGALGSYHFYPWVVGWEQLVDQDAAKSCFKVCALSGFPTFRCSLCLGWDEAVYTNDDGRIQVYLAGIHGHNGLTE